MASAFNRLSLSRRQRLLQVASQRQPDLTIVLENIWDPHNVSAILRSCDAAGVHEVHLVYTHERFPRLGQKSSAGVKKWLRISNHRSIRECYATLHRRKFKIYATKIGETARSLYELPLHKPSALVFGNEHRGVSDQAAKLADENFLIPQAGFAESLNVSVAAAVTLYEAFRQRQTRPKKLSQTQQSRLIKTWLEGR